MRNRPWPLVLLALLRVLSPVSSILVNSWISRVGIITYIQLLTSRASGFELFDFFVLPIVSGAAVYAMKSWSYPVFLSITGWTIYTNFKFIQTMDSSFAKPVVMALFSMDFFFVSYFLLLPAVRRVYFDARMRWWEQKPRYTVTFEGSIQKKGSSARKACQLLDISEGGALIKTRGSFKMNSPIDLSFSCLHLTIKLRAIPVHRDKALGRYGLQFMEVHQSEQDSLKKLIRSLAILQAPKRGGARQAAHDFSLWLARLFSDGEGWIPQLPPDKAQAAPDNVISLDSWRQKKKSGRSASKAQGGKKRPSQVARVA